MMPKPRFRPDEVAKHTVGARVSTWTDQDGEFTGESPRLRFLMAQTSRASGLHAVLSSRGAERYHGQTTWTMDDTLAWIAEPEKRGPNNAWSAQNFAIETRRPKRLVAVARIVIEPNTYRRNGVDFARVSFLVSRCARNKGYGVEIVRSLLSLSFEHLGVAEVHASAHPHNAASLRVLQKAGMYVFRHFGPCSDLGRKGHTLTCAVTPVEWREGRSGPRSMIQEIGLFPGGSTTDQ
jgi:RimJ/RimL family protein N-acetyltransferase